jgi:hypothetical protein
MREGRELHADELPAQRAARGAQVRDFEFSLVFDDGTTRHLIGYGTPLRDDEGRRGKRRGGGYRQPHQRGGGAGGRKGKGGRGR